MTAELMLHLYATLVAPMLRTSRTLRMLPSKPPIPCVKYKAASPGPVMPCTALTMGARYENMTLLPMLVSAVAAVSQRSAGERMTWTQRCSVSGGTRTLAGTEYQTSTATTALAIPIAANEARQPNVVPISTENGLPMTCPTAQPTISLASVAGRSVSETSRLTVAATWGV